MHQPLTPTQQILLGQSLLIVCCVFYLIWWSISYRPGLDVSRIGGIRGVLLLVTAAAGIAGVLFSLLGNGRLQAAAPKLNGSLILIGGIAAYVLLLLITRLLLHRPVTTELFLIVAWAVLELALLSKLNGAGAITDFRFAVMIAVLAAAVVSSLVFYVLYYRMEPVTAYRMAMVPLITECGSMCVLLALLLR
ncbi:MAG: hypothetical protein ACOX41_00875 [Anaerovoracaceae bacterium]|jgi:hypothetical protein